MAEEQSSAERTEQATPKRQQDAKRRGQVARSRELSTSMMLLTGGLAGAVLGPALTHEITVLASAGLSIERAFIFDANFAKVAIFEGLLEALWSMAPFLTVMFIAAIAGPISLGGWVLSAQAIAPKGSRLNPLSGLKRVFGVNGLMELFKAMLKFLLLASVATLLLWNMSGEFLSLGVEHPTEAITHAATLLTGLFLTLAAVTCVFAAIDVPYQLWEHAKKLRMTRQEVRDEHKETEGNPQVRARVRAIQREISQRRMIEAIPAADVIVVNPTHFSVALQYREGEHRAPIVVAKGTDILALKIREVARHHDVPIFEAPMLARALHRSTDLGQPIPDGLYVAVAKVLAYVYGLVAARNTRTVPPEAPQDFDIPEEFLSGESG